MSKIEETFANKLNSAGLKFERNCRDLPGTPDVVFRKEKLAIFFHGCFWHSHHCQNQPKSEEWAQNLNDIKKNDYKQLCSLKAKGFQTLIIWECEWKVDSIRAINLITDRLYLAQFAS